MKPKAIICDIDGTIADLTHRLHYVKRPNKDKDYKSFYAELSKDKPKKDVIDIIEYLLTGFQIIFITGRPEEYREITKDWILLNVYCYDLDGLEFKLFMAPEGNRRPDTEIKKEIYEKEIKPYYDVVAVFDDCQRVVDMWRELGLTCFQVDKWKEFK